MHRLGIRVFLWILNFNESLVSLVLFTKVCWDKIHRQCNCLHIPLENKCSVFFIQCPSTRSNKKYWYFRRLSLLWKQPAQGVHGNDQAYQNWFLLIKCPLQTAIFKRLSLKQGTGNRKMRMGNGERGTGTNYETPTHCNSAYKKRLKAENNSVQAFAESTVTTIYLDLFTAVNVYFLLRVLF